MMTLIPWFTALAGARLYVTVTTVRIRTWIVTGKSIKSRIWTAYQRKIEYNMFCVLLQQIIKFIRKPLKLTENKNMKLS